FAANCRFVENITGNGGDNLPVFPWVGGHGGDGAAAYIQSSSATLVNCLLIGNATGNGGTGPSMDANQRGGNGAGLYLAGPGANIVNATFTANTTGIGRGGTDLANRGLGGGVYASAGSLANCILWNNMPDQVNGTIGVTYCDVQGGHSGTGN